MRKFIFSLGIVILFLLPTNQVLAFYKDVPSTNQYYTSIKSLYDANLLPKSTNFQPSDPLTNADLYELLVSFSGAPLADGSTIPYSDVPTDSLYAPYIQTALDFGIISFQDANPKFEPTKSLPKHKVLETMFKSLDIGTNYFFDRNDFPFTDVKTTSSIAPLAQKSADIGILETSTPKLFKMAKRITRAEAADYLYKINQYKKIDSIKITYTNKTPTKNSNNYSFNKTESELINNQSFGTFLDVWQTLQTDYLYNDKINDKDLIFGAIEGMVNQVDDNYTVFEKPGENIILDSLSSEYEGIGAILELIDEKVTIVSPLKNSPAEKAGLKPADIIIKIDGKDVTKQGVSEIIKQIKGPAGTSVKITITREGSPLNFTIKREKLFYETVSYKFLTKGTKKIAYLELKSFNEKTFEEFLKAAEDIVSQDADGLILDLRNNPGGYLGVAINIIGLFSDTSKTAIKMEFADNSIEPYDAPANGLLKDLQTVILINKGSASSSEVLAGALQDYKIAKLIGEKSFGKGVVQDIVEYKDDSLLKYTSAKWLTPNGRDINKKGLTPDRFILKTTTPNTDNQLTAALEEF